MGFEFNSGIFKRTENDLVHSEDKKPFQEVFEASYGQAARIVLHEQGTVDALAADESYQIIKDRGEFLHSHEADELAVTHKDLFPDIESEFERAALIVAIALAEVNLRKMKN